MTQPSFRFRHISAAEIGTQFFKDKMQFVEGGSQLGRLAALCSLIYKGLCETRVECHLALTDASREQVMQERFARLVVQLQSFVDFERNLVFSTLDHRKELEDMKMNSDGTQSIARREQTVLQRRHVDAIFKEIDHALQLKIDASEFTALGFVADALVDGPGSSYSDSEDGIGVTQAAADRKMKKAADKARRKAAKLKRKEAKLMTKAAARAVKAAEKSGDVVAAADAADAAEVARVTLIAAKKAVKKNGAGGDGDDDSSDDEAVVDAAEGDAALRARWGGRETIESKQQRLAQSDRDRHEEEQQQRCCWFAWGQTDEAGGEGTPAWLEKEKKKPMKSEETQRALFRKANSLRRENSKPIPATQVGNFSAERAAELRYQVRQIACQRDRAFVLLDNGDVLVCGVPGGSPTDGDGDDQIDRLKKLPPSAPALVVFHERGVRITQIACGVEHTCAISSMGELYTWGTNHSGQLGHGGKAGWKTAAEDVEEGARRKPATNYVRVPRRVDFFAHLPNVYTRDRTHGVYVVNVTCGPNYTIAITEHGRVYSWGQGSAGQLGLSRPQVQDLWPGQKGAETCVTKPMRARQLEQMILKQKPMRVTPTRVMYRRLMVASAQDWSMGWFTSDAAMREASGDATEQFQPMCSRCKSYERDQIQLLALKNELSVELHQAQADLGNMLGSMRSGAGGVSVVVASSASGASKAGSKQLNLTERDTIEAAEFEIDQLRHDEVQLAVSLNLITTRAKLSEGMCERLSQEYSIHSVNREVLGNHAMQLSQELTKFRFQQAATQAAAEKGTDTHEGIPTETHILKKEQEVERNHTFLKLASSQSEAVDLVRERAKLGSIRVKESEVRERIDRVRSRLGLLEKLTVMVGDSVAGETTRRVQDEHVRTIARLKKELEEASFERIISVHSAAAKEAVELRGLGQGGQGAGQDGMSYETVFRESNNRIRRIRTVAQRELAIANADSAVGAFVDCLLDQFTMCCEAKLQTNLYAERALSAMKTKEQKMHF